MKSSAAAAVSVASALAAAAFGIQPVSGTNTQASFAGTSINSSSSSSSSNIWWTPFLPTPRDDDDEEEHYPRINDALVLLGSNEDGGAKKVQPVEQGTVSKKKRIHNSLRRVLEESTPDISPTIQPSTFAPTTQSPTSAPCTQSPTSMPSTQSPTVAPTASPTALPTATPTVSPTLPPISPTIIIAVDALTDFITVNSDEPMSLTYHFSNTIQPWDPLARTRGVHYSTAGDGGTLQVNATAYDSFDLQGSPLLGANNDTRVNFGGTINGNGGQVKSQIVLQNAAHWYVEAGADINLLIPSTVFTRHLWIFGDGTGTTLELDPAFVPNEPGSTADGMASLILSNNKLITHTTESLPIREIPGAGPNGGPLIKGQVVFENEGGSIWNTQTNAQTFPAAIWMRVDTTFQTDTDLTHAGETSAGEANAFQTEEENVTITKTGMANLILAGEVGFLPGATVNVQEGAVIFQTNPAAGFLLSGGGVAGPEMNLQVAAARVEFQTELAEMASFAALNGSTTTILHVNPDGTLPIIHATGLALLDGTLIIRNSGGYTLSNTPQVILSAGTLSGAFDTILDEAGTGLQFQMDNSNNQLVAVLPVITNVDSQSDFITVNSNESNLVTYRFSNTVPPYNVVALTRGVHYVGGGTLEIDATYTPVNLQGSPLLGATNGTRVNFGGTLNGNEGQIKAQIVLLNGGHWYVKAGADLNFLLASSLFTRQLWVFGDGTGTLELDPGFVSDFSQGGTIANGMGAIRLSNCTLITHSTQSLPVTPRPDGSGGQQINGHMVFENDAGSTWIVRSNPQIYIGAVWVSVDATFQTDVDLTHAGETTFSSHMGMYYAANAFQTREDNLRVTKTGAASLILAKEVGFKPGGILDVQEGGVVFRSNPAAGFLQSTPTVMAGPEMHLQVAAGARVEFQTELLEMASFTALNDSMTVFEINPSGNMPMVNVTGTASLDGTLVLRNTKGHAVTSDPQILVDSGISLTGAYDVLLDEAATGWQIQISGNQLIAT